MAKEKPLRITDEEVAQLCHAITIACGEMIGQVEQHEHRLETQEKLWDSDKKGVDNLYKKYVALEDWVGQIYEQAQYRNSEIASINKQIDLICGNLLALDTPWYVKRWRQLANLVKPPESF